MMPEVGDQPSAARRLQVPFCFVTALMSTSYVSSMKSAPSEDGDLSTCTFPSGLIRESFRSPTQGCWMET